MTEFYTIVKKIVTTSLGLFLFVLTTCYGGEERYSNFIDVEPGQQNDTIIIIDDRFGNDNEWAKIDQTEFVNNLILFEVNEHGNKIITTTSTFTLHLEIGLWYNGDDPLDEPSDIRLESLEFEYDPNTASVTPYRSFKHYSDAHKMRLVIKNVLSSQGGVNTAPDLRLTGEIHLKRLYDFNNSSYPSFTNLPQTVEAVDQFLATWNEMPGAESYDLEWVHYDTESRIGQMIVGSNVVADPDYNYLFRNNSTRVNIEANQFNVNLLYRQGFLIFRIRGVRPKNGLREHSTWSTSDVSTLHTLPLGLRENDINWQSSVVYAEEGKHIPATQYFDGSMRNRQSVTLSNAIGRTIVGQTMFDHHGRPSVNLIPVPTEETKINFVKNFATTNSGEPFTKEIWEARDCIEEAATLGNSPAANYYSGDNPRRNEGKHQYIPDANGYTYTMTEYTPDLTGRIQSQSGVGETFAMGNGHETRYFYAKPTQRELDRLFGSDVGDANHYLKNGVMDPNGQLSISYIDGHGRVVATALAGEKPDNVQQIDTGYVDPSITNQNLLHNQIINDALVSTHKFIVAVPGEHTFSYDFTSELYTNSCTSLCFDCKYDLRIELSRTDCRLIGTEEKIVRTLNNYDLNELSNSCMTSELEESITVDLDVGEYAITKTLTVSLESLDYYTELFLDEAACVPDLESLIQLYLDETDFSDCNMDCDDCLESLGSESQYINQLIADLSEVGQVISVEDAAASYQSQVRECNAACTSISECDAIFEMMLMDVSRDGQYGRYDLDQVTGIYSISDPTSVFYDDRYQDLPDGYVYQDDDGQASMVYNSAGDLVRPELLTISEFLDAWQPSWASALVVLHPEYCIYQNWCLAPNIQDSHAWEEEVRGLDDYSAAVNAGFVSSEGIVSDPFFEEGAAGYDCKALRDSLLEHIVRDDLSTPGILDIAVDQVYGTNPLCNIGLGSGSSAEDDAVWEIYKALYLGIRSQLMTKTRNELSASCNNPPSVCIGNDCGILYTPNPYEEKEPRFYDIDLTGEAMTTEDAELIAANAENEITIACQTDCANNADVWLMQISRCLEDMQPSTIANLKERLIAVCQLGCDIEHPNGASTTPGGTLTAFGDTSFEDVFDSVFEAGLDICDTECSPYTITGIYPYEVIAYPGIRTFAAFDEEHCVCERIIEMEACYNSNDQGYGSFELFLGQFSGNIISQEDIDQLKDYCTSRSSLDPCTARPAEILIPPILECDVCKDCFEIAILASAFDAQCSITEYPSFYQQMTGYLNTNLGWNLEVQDYLDFFEKCEMTAYCSSALVLCPSSPALVNDDLNSCEEHLRRQAQVNAQSTYDRLFDEAREEFREEYLAKCLSNMDEYFEGDMLTHEYHYTLYYYDQAGNLVQTVPPNGVRPIEDETILESIQEQRVSDIGDEIFPDHSFYTKYVYNSLNQVVRQISPDIVEKQFFYDQVGRLIVSQDGRQRELFDEDRDDNVIASRQAYSYTLYDDLGRIVEVGEKATDIPFTQMTDMENWLTAGDPSSRSQVTKTYYDEQPDFGTLAIAIEDAANLRTRVAVVTIETVYDGNDSTYEFATHYGYDATGNVKTLVQEIVELHDIGHRYKRMDYDYDYISGNVNAVYYQRGEADQFTHRYTYDANNRLSEVYTSLIHEQANPSGLNLLLWDRDAAYEYYDHGPLSRIDIGEYRVQGTDYAYTLQGWIKGVNSGILRSDKDMGGDGHEDGLNQGVARDAMAYTLGYFEEDFDPIGAFPFVDLDGSELNQASLSLFNGNIRHMTIHNRQLGDPIGYSYQYDQLHRIKSMASHQNADIDQFQWGSIPQSTNYSMAASYDGNGNILHMMRTGIPDGGSTSTTINDMEYIYEAGTNKLVGPPVEVADCDPVVYVSEPVTQNEIKEADRQLVANSEVDGSAIVTFRAGEEVCLNPGFEVEASGFGIFEALNQECQQSGTIGTYVYDGTGNMIRNESGSSIAWSSYGKVLEVKNEDASQIVSFGYDATQNRSKKSVLDNNSSITKNLYYIRDVQGNTMAIYEQVRDTLTWKEQYLYGSSRLGGIKPMKTIFSQTDTLPLFVKEEQISLGWKYYECTNHLGNVLAVANDRKQKIDIDDDQEADYFDPTILSATDYYPFGMDMPSRAYANEEYRYGFNGKEKDPGEEWGDGSHYDYGSRIYNPEIGRFLSVDPLTNDYPSWTPFAFAMNRVIDGVDLDGLEYKSVTDSDGNVTGFEWDPSNAFGEDGSLNDGYFERGILIDDNENWAIGEFNEEKQRYESYNIGSSTMTVYSYSIEIDAEGNESRVKSSETYNSSSLPSDPLKFGTVEPGFYNGVRHKHLSKYWALQLQTVEGSIDLPAVDGHNPATGKSYVRGANIHKAGKNNFTGSFWNKKNYVFIDLFDRTLKHKFKCRYSGVSEGCQIVDINKWEDFMANFPEDVGRIGVILNRNKFSKPSERTIVNPDAGEISLWTKLGLLLNN